MATLTIRNLDELVMRKLEERAALQGWFVKDEARAILIAAVANDPEPLT
jgi:plasmid stability protein